MIIIQHRANTIKKFNETSNAFGCRKCILRGGVQTSKLNTMISKEQFCLYE